MSGFFAYPRATSWLYDVLTTVPIAGVLGVYEDAAPQGVTTATSVWIEFEALAPGEDVDEVGKQRIWTEFAFRVSVCTRGRSTRGLQTIADEIDNRLHRKSGTADGGLVISCTRSQEVAGKALAQGVEYRELGGVFNLIVQPT